MRTYSENVQVESAFDPADFTNATQVGNVIDTQAFGGPYRNAAFVIQMNTGSATTGNFLLKEGTTTSPVTSVSGGTLGTAQAASLADWYIVNVDLSKRKRYLRISIVGTGTAGAAAATCHLFNGEFAAPTPDATSVITL